MKKFLKVLGAAVLVAGFAPYRFEVDDETGTQKLQALLWSVAKTPAKDDDGKPVLSFNFGLLSPFKKEEEEAHLFSDELTVDYGVREDGEAVTADEEAPAGEEEASGEPESSEETEAAPEPEKPEEPETPASDEDA